MVIWPKTNSGGVKNGNTARNGGVSFAFAYNQENLTISY